MKPNSLIRTAIVLCSLALAPLAVAQVAYAPPPTDASAVELHKLGLEKRSTFKEKGLKYETGRAEIFINAPVSAVRGAVTDYNNYAKIVPKFQKAKVLKRSGASADVYLMIPIMKGAAIVWTVQHFDPPAPYGKFETVFGKSIQGNVDALNTRWSYRAVDAQHSILIAEVYVEPKLPVPAASIVKEAQRAAAEAVVSVRAHAESVSKKVAGVP
jgi:ribosome-associated toxin RatA of RatAB toxin-antitoxin module